MLEPRRLGYIRTSPSDCPEALPLSWADGLAETFTDHSGPRQGRPERRGVLAALTSGDTLVVYSMNRLASTREELEHLLSDLAVRRVAVEFVKEAVTLKPSSPARSRHDLALVMAGVRWQLEAYAELQAGGIKQAKKIRRRYTGRPMKLDPSKIRAMVQRYRALPAKDDSATRIAADFDVSRQTMYRYVRAGDPLLDAADLAKKATGQGRRASSEALLKRAETTKRHAIALRRKAFAESQDTTLAEAKARAQPEAKAAAQALAETERKAKQTARRAARDEDRKARERRSAEQFAKYGLSVKGTPQPDAPKVSDKDLETE